MSSTIQYAKYIQIPVRIDNSVLNTPESEKFLNREDKDAQD
jgi:hypothetical protein